MDDLGGENPTILGNPHMIKRFDAIQPSWESKASLEKHLLQQTYVIYCLLVIRDV